MRRSAPGESSSDATRFADTGRADAEMSGERQRPRYGVGSVIASKYRLEQLLGEGGMGSVWRAHHLQLDQPVAIKLLIGDPNDTMLSERLKIEARSAARLVHPNIVRVFDIDVYDADPFIVMEFLSGESFGQLLERGPLSPQRALQIMLPIAEALALAHSKGIVHRDVKPDNVLLTETDDGVQPKLLDFGVAKLTSGAAADGSLTGTGILVGSPDYMSPEQARGRTDIDHRTDIWSFCVVLYEAISGGAPFEGQNYNALMTSILEDVPPPLPLDDSLDAELVALILQGLCKDKAARPSTMQDLGRQLAQWLLARDVKVDACGTSLESKWITKTSPKAVESEPALPSRHGWPAYAVAGLLIAAAILAFFSRPTPPARVLKTAAVVAPAVSFLPQSSAAAALPSAAPSVQIAETAPAPSVSSGSSAKTVKSGSKARGLPPNPTPVRANHDDSHELLQAY